MPTQIKTGAIAITKEIARTLQELQAKARPSISFQEIPIPVGFAVAGQVDNNAGIVHFAPNLVWRHFPLRQHLREFCEMPVSITNDVRAAAWGEWRYGAGRECPDAVYIFLGTGIGGAVVSTGRMLIGDSNAAGELGHIVIERRGPVCTCGNQGCFEALAGGWALARNLKEAVAANAKEGAFLLQSVQGHAEMLTAKHLFQGYELNDPLSVQLFNEFVETVAAAASGLVNVFNPKKLIFGGGIISGAPFVVPMIEIALKKRALPIAVKSLEVLSSSLGPEAGVIGAAAFALNNQTI
jgi:glucokinase